jgi:3-oxoacyl-[acyl-carrier protein] reductase
MIDRAAMDLGRLDTLVVSAGGGADRKPVVTSDPLRWARTLQVNLLGAYHASRAAIPHMERAGGGKIITLGSGLGHRPSPGNCSYNVAKAGLSMFTRCLAMEVWSLGIDVNEVIPGPVYTALTADVFSPRDGKRPPIAESENVKTPEECMNLIMFLATYPAGGPTGQTFSLARRPI